MPFVGLVFIGVVNFLRRAHTATWSHTSMLTNGASTRSRVGALFAPGSFFFMLTLRHCLHPVPFGSHPEFCMPPVASLGISKKQTIRYLCCEIPLGGLRHPYSPAWPNFPKPLQMSRSPIHADNHGSTGFSYGAKFFSLKLTNEEHCKSLHDLLQSMLCCGAYLPDLFGWLDCAVNVNCDAPMLR